MAVKRSFLQLLDSAGCILALGIDSAQSALALGKAGAQFGAIGGFSVSAIQGKPDNALLSYSEYLTALKNTLALAPHTYFLVDGETGFGDPARMMADFEGLGNIGVVFIEDQVAGDKRCGHMDRHAIVSVAEMSSRIKLALKGRHGKEPLLMARTDARSAEGSIEAAINRAKAYLDAGVEAIFIEAPRTKAEIDQIAKELQGAKLLMNLIEGGKTPELPVSELKNLGFTFIIRPIAVTLMYSKIVTEMVAEFYGSGELEKFYQKHGKPDVKEFSDFIGLKRS